jgi:hypothetical protein
MYASIWHAIDRLIIQVREALGRANLAMRGASGANNNNGTVCTAGQFTDVVPVTVIPKRTGRFLLVGSTYGHASVNGLSAALVRFFDGTAGYVPTPMSGVDSGGTNTTRTIGASISVEAAGFPLGTAVTFTLQVEPTTQNYGDTLSMISVVEISN